GATEPNPTAATATHLPPTQSTPSYCRTADADDADVKPWNLRPRRLTIDDGNGNRVKSGRLENNEKEKEQAARKELWISLSKEEIEEDVYAFTGSRPARRPKKRNRTVQKQVDNLFPGLYLVGVSADSYRV
ncbi:uncharacterized protein LOC143611311, partial [Bidens hawaiensis]|uniref:uncharacterized protein LOC143611311 n=1 Tax=Bidens hawaiensis TaxID=980011 RepID=UPI00404AF23E